MGTESNINIVGCPGTVIKNENAPTQEEETTQSFVDGEKDNDGWTIGAEPSQPYIVNVGSMPQPMMNMDGEGDLVVNDKPSAPDSRDSANGKWNKFCR